VQMSRTERAPLYGLHRHDLIAPTNCRAFGSAPLACFLRHAATHVTTPPHARLLECRLLVVSRGVGPDAPGERQRGSPPEPEEALHGTLLY